MAYLPRQRPRRQPSQQCPGYRPRLPRPSPGARPCARACCADRHRLPCHGCATLLAPCRAAVCPSDGSLAPGFRGPPLVVLAPIGRGKALICTEPTPAQASQPMGSAPCTLCARRRPQTCNMALPKWSVKTLQQALAKWSVQRSSGRDPLGPRQLERLRPGACGVARCCEL
jgi:hypothetical protein